LSFKAKDLTVGRLMGSCLRLRTNMQKDWGNKLGYIYYVSCKRSGGF
jgi:hypothetical protein